MKHWIRWLPGLDTLRRYEPAWLPHDIFAGLVLATMLVPVGIAYAEASGLPGIYGLYATIIPLLVYAVFGPSRILKQLAEVGYVHFRAMLKVGVCDHCSGRSTEPGGDRILDEAFQREYKLRAMQDLWWAEAARNNVLPLDWRGPERFSVELTGKPSLAAGRKTFIYETPLAALPEASAPDLKNKSFRITAEAEIPPGGAEGIIFTQGGFTGGWGFFIQQGKLVGLHSHVALERYRVASTEPVPAGKVTLAMDFKSDGAGMGKGGTITLLANGKKIGEGRVEKTTPFKYSLFEGQDIGEDTGTPVDFSYAPPFKFTGKLGRVSIELK